MCPACGGLLLDRPGVQAALRERGLDGSPLRCRCAETREAKAAWRRRRANLPHESPGLTPRTFADFRARVGAEGALDAAQLFAAGGGPAALTLVGEPGSGKSHLLEAIGRTCLERGQRVRYELASDLLDALRATFGEDSPVDFDEVMGQYRSAEVLLLDDVGMEKGTEFAVDRLTGLVDFRIREGKRLAVATNLDDGGMSERLGRRMASRLYDAYSGSVRVVWLTCGDYRLGGL